MTTYLLMGGVLFAACILGGVAMGAYTFWLPRHRLNRIFKQCRKARLLKAAASKAEMSELPMLELVAA